MDKTEISKLWQKTIALLKSEMSPISLETWILTADPIGIVQGEFLLSVPSDFHRSYAEQYAPLIRNAIKSASNREYSIRIVLAADAAAAAAVGITTERTATGSPVVAVSNFSRLNNHYSFETFVVGSGNRFAHAACVAVAEKQGGRNFNPLFLYGGSGLGKTHLMHAIGNYVREKYPAKKVLYVQCEQFVNEFISTIKENKYDDFRNKYRHADMLLIDDIQFIEGKEQMQIEFFHTFNSLYDTGKNIVMTCDKPPVSLISLEERLRTRFSCGLTVDIQPPDYETRVAILRRLAQTADAVIPDDVYDYIATNIATNIRELEGSFNTFLAFSSLAGAKTLDVAQAALKDLISLSNNRKVSLQTIVEVVSRFYGLTVEDLKSTRRSKEVSQPRQMAMYLARSLLSMTYPQIGQEFGGRDHTTVMHGYQKVAEELKTSDRLRSELDEIRKRMDG